MARKLKTFETSLGFYDLAIAAPSMKAALEARGAGSNLSHRGVAKEADDPDVVAATMSKPGVVLKRPAGSNGRFAEHSDLPTDLGSAGKGRRRKGDRAKPTKGPPPEISDRTPEGPLPNSRNSRSAVRSSAGVRRPPGKEIAKGARRQRTKRRRRWTRPSVSMRKRWRISRPRLRFWRSTRELRTTVGERKENGCRLRSVVRGSRVAATILPLQPQGRHRSRQARGFTVLTRFGFDLGVE